MRLASYLWTALVSLVILVMAGRMMDTAETPFQRAAIGGLVLLLLNIKWSRITLGQAITAGALAAQTRDIEVYRAVRGKDAPEWEGDIREFQEQRANEQRQMLVAAPIDGFTALLAALAILRVI